MAVDAAGEKNRKPVRIRTALFSKPGELKSACKRKHLQVDNLV
ncbi:hypothetical protein [Polaromonas sp. CG9_12]|nr:hypothetical protein [Polaromonas sp. CG_9.11]MBG6077730.1 hypothetical protein [Polaromonas sp. CG_9.11]CDS50142.1 hypothetical protein [Polaromonas sp. CG9_12]